MKITKEQYQDSLKVVNDYEKQLIDEFKETKDFDLIIDWLFVSLSEMNPEMTKKEFDEVLNIWINQTRKQLQAEELMNGKY